MPAAEQQVAAVAGGDAVVDQQQQGAGFGWQTIKSIAFRVMIVYFISSLVRNWRSGPSTSINGTATPTASVVPPSHNMYSKMQRFDLYVYLSLDEGRFDAFDDESQLFWKEEGMVYGDWTSGPNGDGSHVVSRTIPCPTVLQNNGSIYIHVFVVKSGQSPDPKSRYYVKRELIYHSRMLNKYKKKYYKKTTNLLTGRTEQSEEDQKKAEIMKHEILSHWHPNLTINLIDDHSPWQKGW
jgi:hypothetical protein